MIAVAASLLHQLLQLGGVALFQQLALRRARHRDDGVAVRHGRDVAGVLADGLAQLRRDRLQVPHRRIFFKNHLAVLLRVDFQRVALADTQGTADLLWDDDPPEVVNTSDDTGCFHILLLHFMRSKSHCYCLQTMGNYANGRQGRKRKGACRNLSGRIWCIFQKRKLQVQVGHLLVESCPKIS